nr:MAG TPA: hypothetical protein [Caudoviricetes sp.]
MQSNPQRIGAEKMTRTITVNAVVRKYLNDLYVLEWDDDKYGTPTEENVLKALKDGLEPYDVIDSDDYGGTSYISVSDIDIEDEED